MNLSVFSLDVDQPVHGQVNFVSKCQSSFEILKEKQKSLLSFLLKYLFIVHEVDVFKAALQLTPLSYMHVRTIAFKNPAHGLVHFQRYINAPLFPRNFRQVLFEITSRDTHVLPHLDHEQVQFDYLPLFHCEILFFDANGLDLLVDAPFLQELHILHVIALKYLISIPRRLLLVVLLQERVVEDVACHIPLPYKPDFLTQGLLLVEHLLVVRVIPGYDIVYLLHI